MKDRLKDYHAGIFAGIPIQQWQSDLWLWEQFFKHNRIASMVELGTGSGGMSLFFILQSIQHRFTFDTYDLSIPQIMYEPVAKLVNFQQYFHSGDIFEDLLKTIQMKLDHSNHPVLLYCDNGNKPKEAYLFSPHLQNGDFMAVHDWMSEFKPDNIPGGVEAIFTDQSDEMHSLSRWFKRK